MFPVIGGEFIGFLKLVSQNALLGTFLSHGNSKIVCKLSVGKLVEKFPSWGEDKVETHVEIDFCDRIIENSSSCKFLEVII
jgi:hypothetical protein